MRLAISPAPNLAGFGRASQVVDEDTGSVLCFTATRPSEYNESQKDDWIHFPKPLPLNKAQAVINYLRPS